MNGELQIWISVAMGIFIPLAGALFGGIVYWLRKLDDRLFQVRGDNLTKQELHGELGPLYERIRGIDSQLAEVRQIMLSHLSATPQRQ